MKKLLFIFLLAASQLQAAVGDTTKINVFNNFHMNRYGNFDQWVYVDPATPKSQRIWLKYTLGCLSNGQCEWDYTIRLFARQRTGKLDSTLLQAPNFRVNGQVKDSVLYSTDTTYNNVFNATTKQANLVATTQLLVVLYNDPQFPTKPTDSLRVWPAAFYQYTFDTAGVKTDSVWVPETNKIVLQNTPYYNVFEVINDIEIGRFISPYAASFPKTFKYDYVYDITDYASLLNDSVQLRIQYQGYSYGFTATMDVFMVEGEPAREAIQVENVYNGGFPYGRANNSIENYLTPKTFTVPADAKYVKAKVYITGHGAESNQGCSEFCSKNYFLKLNGSLFATQAVWKDDCGKNAIINQPGTWIYDRSNWCPGEKVPVYEYALNVAPGSTNTFDMDMEAFIANGDASYNIGVQLIYYNEYNYELDGGIEDIKAPTSNFWHNRTNPICDNAKVVLKNFGKTPITQALIHYKIGDGTEQEFNWKGNLEADKEVEITLPWLFWPANNTNNTFTVTLVNVNGANDGNATNNMLKTAFVKPQTLPLKFIIETRTNNRPEQNSYTIRNNEGILVFSRSFTQPNTLHRDTFSYSAGCFTFRFEDSGKNGLNFWAQQSEGSGTVRFVTAQMPIQILRTFNSDFGTFLEFNFTSQFPVGKSELPTNTNDITLFPSPANEYVTLSSKHTYINQVNIMTIDGKLVKTIAINNQETQISLADLPQGMYVFEIRDANGNFTYRKLPVAK
jgi:hypothetical protein